MLQSYRRGAKPQAAGKNRRSRLRAGHSANLPVAAALAAEHLVGLGVVELVRLRVPLQLLAGPQRDRADVADDDRAGPDLDVADGRLAGLHALEEVAHVVGRSGRVEL